MFRSEKLKIAQGLGEPQWGRVAGRMIAIILIISFIGFIVILHRGFSYSMLILFVIALALAYVIDNTSFGRYIYAIGGNAEAAHLSGIDTSWQKMKLYVLHSVIIATAAVVYLGRVGQAVPAAGTGFEFTAITGCVVGGTSITGGRGRVLGAVIGTMIMAALDNGMSILNLPPALQYIVRGGVLLFAIILDVIASDRKAKTL